MQPTSAQLHTELWTSWASLLRSYAAAHGLNAPQHAVVEISAAEITLRVGAHWLRFTPTLVEGSGRSSTPFRLNENGTVALGFDPEEEMDITAERFAREMMSSSA